MSFEPYRRLVPEPEFVVSDAAWWHIRFFISRIQARTTPNRALDSWPLSPTISFPGAFNKIWLGGLERAKEP